MVRSENTYMLTHFGTPGRLKYEYTPQTMHTYTGIID